MSSFPGNLVEVLKPVVGAVDGVGDVLGRPIRRQDQTGLAAVFPGEWAPQDTEIGVGGLGEPTIQRYTLNVQYAWKGTPEEAARAHHSTVSKKIRAMLYRDPDLRVALAGLSDEFLGVTERFARLGVPGQRFFSNEVDGLFVFLSHIDMWVETVQ